MIWHSGFDRLLQKLDELAMNDILGDKIFVQIGNSKYIPKHFKTIDFCSPQEFDDLISEFSMVVTHAGVGSMMSAILCNKPVVVVPRKACLNEAGDDHQLNTSNQFEQEGFILVGYEVSELEDRIIKSIAVFAFSQ